MSLRSKHKTKVLSSEITPESSYFGRREFIKGAGLLLAGSASFAPRLLNASLRSDDELTPEKIVTQYNNFYEFGTDKGDPYAYAHELTTEPWTVEVSGEAKKVGKYGIEDIL